LIVCVQKAANKSSETDGDDSRAMDCNNQVTKYLVIKKTNHFELRA